MKVNQIKIYTISIILFIILFLYNNHFSRNNTEYKFDYNSKEKEHIIWKEHGSQDQTGNIIISRKGYWLYLKFDDTFQSVVCIGKPNIFTGYYYNNAIPYILGFEFFHTMVSAWAGLSKIIYSNNKIIFIGLGAGSLPSFLAYYYPELIIEVWEIDEKLVEIVQSKLKVKNMIIIKNNELPKKGYFSVIIGNAIDILEKNQHIKIATLFIDVYNHEGQIPEYFLNKDFFSKCKNILLPEGLLISNVFLYASETFSNLLSSVFESVLKIKSNTNIENNIIYVSGNIYLSNKKWIDESYKRADTIGSMWNFKGSDYLLDKITVIQ